MAALGHTDLLRRSVPEPRRRPIRSSVARASTVFDTTQFPLQLVNAAVGAYLSVLTGLAWYHRFSRPQSPSAPAPQTRFAVLVPAHDEQDLIAETVTQLLGLSYPRDLFVVHVVADNCTDETARLATAAGAVTHERTGDPGKGPALQWLIGTVLESSARVDAFVIVDADSALSANFLAVMDNRLRSGDRVIQAYYGVKEPEASAAVAIRFAALAARHHLRPAAREVIGCSAGLFGNGMVFASEVLQGRALTAHLTEDIELHIDLVLSGERVAFAHDAHVVAEMPIDLDDARSQNQRWERGRIEMMKRYAFRLLTPGKGTKLRERVRRADVAADLLVPPTSVLAMGATAALSAAIAGRLEHRSRLSSTNLTLASVSALGLAAYVLSALRMVNAPRSVYRSLLQAPRSILWKAQLWLGVLRPEDDIAWQRTKRNAENIDPRSTYDTRAAGGAPCAI